MRRCRASSFQTSYCFQEVCKKLQHCNRKPTKSYLSSYVFMSPVERNSLASRLPGSNPDKLLWKVIQWYIVPLHKWHMYNAPLLSWSMKRSGQKLGKLKIIATGRVVTWSTWVIQYYRFRLQRNFWHDYMVPYRYHMYICMELYQLAVIDAMMMTIVTDVGLVFNYCIKMTHTGPLMGRRALRWGWQAGLQPGHWQWQFQLRTYQSIRIAKLRYQ